MKQTFTGKTRLFLAISGAIIVVALILQIAGLGLNLGVDFTGGSLLNYSVGESFDVNDVEMILASAGYEGSQITKAAPSDASIARQAELAQQAEADAAAVEAGEAHVHEDGSVHYGDHEAEAAEEETAETAALLDTDKSGIEDDGLTDLQLRLSLVDESEGLEEAVAAAVAGVRSEAEQVSYGPLTNSMIVEKDFETDFAGGYVSAFKADECDAEEVKAAVEAALEENFNVLDLTVAQLEADEDTGASLYVLVNLDDQASQVRALLEKEMVAKYPNFSFVSIDHVSAIAGRDLLSNAVKALLIAFACMLVYIAIRFDVFSGLAALFGLIHDVLIMCAVMVFCRAFFQVNSSFIAAVLTIVGYSINNTIIVFDRIRETSRKPGWTEKSRREIVEVSVSNTLSRTINTSLTTLITLVALYAFGVESIREFAFPLIVGMLAGTYSSVLLSGQVWAMWMDKRNAARKTRKA